MEDSVELDEWKLVLCEGSYERFSADCSIEKGSMLLECSLPYDVPRLSDVSVTHFHFCYVCIIDGELKVAQSTAHFDRALVFGRLCIFICR